MKLAFYIAFQPNATLMDKAISVCSFGKYSHVELVFSDGIWFSISAREGVARFKKIIPKPESWAFIDLNLDVSTERHLRKLAKDMVGMEYDYIGALFSITPICIQKSNKIFCSEAITNLINRTLNFRKLRDGCLYSPSALYKEAVKIKNRG